MFEFRGQISAETERRVPLGPLSASVELSRIVLGTAVGLGAALLDIATGGVEKSGPTQLSRSVGQISVRSELGPTGFPPVEPTLSQVLDRP